MLIVQEGTLQGKTTPQLLLLLLVQKQSRRHAGGQLSPFRHLVIAFFSCLFFSVESAGLEDEGWNQPLVAYLPVSVFIMWE